MKTDILTPAQKNLKLTLWNAEAESVASSDIYLWLRECGLPSEVAIPLKNLVDDVTKVGDQIINIGKIILIKIIEFVKAHPNLLIGIAIGAAIGALVATIPFLGTFLAPMVTVFAVTIAGIAGHRIDKLEKGKSENSNMNLIAISQDVIEIAKAFFKLLIDVFNAVFDKHVLSGV